MFSKSIFKIPVTSPATMLFLVLAGCNPSPKPQWERRNNDLIREYRLTAREIPALPSPVAAPSLQAGEPHRLGELEDTELYPGVKGRIFWGNGTLTSILNLGPDAVLPLQKLPADRFLFVLAGNVRLEAAGNSFEMISREREEPDGTHSATPRNDFIYQPEGTETEVTAGSAGARLMEIYNPLRQDYLEKMGVTDLPAPAQRAETGGQKNWVPNEACDLYDVQLTKLADGVFSRLVGAGNMMLSFISLDPGRESPVHIHPEEQVTYLRRGSLTAGVLDKEYPLSPGDLLRVPGNMVHSSISGELGADVLDIFWPSREDYLKQREAALKTYHSIIPEGAKPELVVDGAATEPYLTFSEGPKWMDGKIYFSNMYFDQDWNADPGKSAIVELDPDGSYHNIMEGKMQANGLYPYKNGNLLVCDMIGHRILEMTTSGRVVRVVADQYDGKPIDGPNDIITDKKGGIYFTDPQFTMETDKFQPGRAVYYISPDGMVKRVVGPNEFAMPNGILLSPDGKTLYINNCYDNETWYPVDSEKDNFVWAYDVKDDGALTNMRKFAELRLTGNVLDRKGRSSGADGMAIDKRGNIYVATYAGVQIFDSMGSFIGIINLPTFPVSLCFGDRDMKTLYIVSYDKVYKIPTLVEGYVNYL